jgi:hypothetical protein
MYSHRQNLDIELLLDKNSNQNRIRPPSITYFINSSPSKKSSPKNYNKQIKYHHSK